MIAPRATRTLIRLSTLAAIATLAAVVAAQLIAQPYAAVPERLRPGAWSQDAIALVAALGLLRCNRRIIAGDTGFWPLWAGFLGYLIYGYALYAFDRVVNPVFPLYLLVFSTASFAAFVFLRHVDPAALPVRPGTLPPRRLTAGVFAAFAAIFGTVWSFMLVPSLPSRAAIPEITILVLDLTLALPLLMVAAVLLWRARAAGDVLAVVLLVKVATLGLSVFLGTALASLAHGAPWVPGELALYAVMGLAPALLLVRWMRWIRVGAG